MKKLIAALIGVIDVLLLGVIIFSVVSGWRFGEALPFAKQSVPTAESKPQTEEKEQSETKSKTLLPKTSSKTSSVTSSATSSKTSSKISSKTSSKVSSKTSSKTSSKATAKKKTTKSNYPKASKMSTKKNIKISEAEGFSAAKGKWTNLSKKKTKITALSALKGGWKAYMVTDPKNKQNSYREDYMNMRIDVKKNNKVTVTFKWNHYVNGKKVKQKDTKFTGKWKNKKIVATGEGKVKFTAFWLDGKKEYAVGTYIWPSGEKAVIGLMRK